MTRSHVSVPGASRLKTVHCSFCNKDKDAVAKIVAGPGVYICDECVNLCQQIIAAENTGESVREFTAWDAQPDDELLASMARTQAVVAQVDAAIRDHASVLRGRGISWSRIGEALGVSKQAAWERFSGED
jgi:ClpX C4-type zinc finger